MDPCCGQSFAAEEPCRRYDLSSKGGLQEDDCEGQDHGCWQEGSWSACVDTFRGHTCRCPQGAVRQMQTGAVLGLAGPVCSGLQPSQNAAGCLPAGGSHDELHSSSMQLSMLVWSVALS